ncbi:MAG: hypothetical protein P8186_13570 [Anaerolineae bacterium]
MSGKLKIVVSDFHLGAGPLDISENPLEDFIADEAFAHFLEALRAESNRDNKEVELIINGDFFEFLQVPVVDEFDPQRTYPPEAYYDSSQACKPLLAGCKATFARSAGSDWAARLNAALCRKICKSGRYLH